MYKLGFDFCRIIWVSWNRLRRLFACSLSWKILCRIFIISFLNVWMNLTLNLSWLEIVCAHVCVCVCVCARACCLEVGNYIQFIHRYELLNFCNFSCFTFNWLCLERNSSISCQFSGCQDIFIIFYFFMCNLKNVFV
jgi:hypothetical protein